VRFRKGTGGRKYVGLVRRGLKGTIEQFGGKPDLVGTQKDVNGRFSTGAEEKRAKRMERNKITGGRRWRRSTDTC